MPELSLSALLAQLAALARPELCGARPEEWLEITPGEITCGLAKNHGGRHYDRKIKVFFD